MLESYKELIAAKSEIRQLKKQLEEAKPVVRAHWKPLENLYIVCSNCDRGYLDKYKNMFNYCPHCGARMDGEK